MRFLRIVVFALVAMFALHTVARADLSDLLQVIHWNGFGTVGTPVVLQRVDFSNPSNNNLRQCVTVSNASSQAINFLRFRADYKDGNGNILFTRVLFTTSNFVIQTGQSSPPLCWTTNVDKSQTGVRWHRIRTYDLTTLEARSTSGARWQQGQSVASFGNGVQPIQPPQRGPVNGSLGDLIRAIQWSAAGTFGTPLVVQSVVFSNPSADVLSQCITVNNASNENVNFMEFSVDYKDGNGNVLFHRAIHTDSTFVIPPGQNSSQHCWLTDVNKRQTGTRWHNIRTYALTTQTVRASDGSTWQTGQSLASFGNSVVSPTPSPVSNLTISNIVTMGCGQFIIRQVTSLAELGMTCPSGLGNGKFVSVLLRGISVNDQGQLTQNGVDGDLPNACPQFKVVALTNNRGEQQPWIVASCHDSNGNLQATRLVLRGITYANGQLTVNP